MERTWQLGTLQRLNHHQPDHQQRADEQQRHQLHSRRHEHCRVRDQFVVSLTVAPTILTLQPPTNSAGGFDRHIQCCGTRCRLSIYNGKRRCRLGMGTDQRTTEPHWLSPTRRRPMTEPTGSSSQMPGGAGQFNASDVIPSSPISARSLPRVKAVSY